MEKCRRMKRPQFMSQNWVYSWLWKSSKTHQQYCRSQSFAMKTIIPTNGPMVKNHISLKNKIRIPCNTKNFIPIVVPGLSTSSSSSSPSSTSMTPSRQEIDHPTSSTISSTSPTMMSSTVSSESVAGQKRWDPCSSEISEELLTKPTQNSKPNKNEDLDQERRDPCHSEIPEWLQEFRESLVDQRLTRKFFSWIILGTCACEKCGFGWTQCLYSLP